MFFEIDEVVTNTFVSININQIVYFRADATNSDLTKIVLTDNRVLYARMKYKEFRDKYFTFTKV